MDKNVESCEQVIKNIKTQLTGDNEHDRKIIRQAMDDYSDNPNAEEIIHELSRMLTKTLTEEEMNRFEEAMHKSIPELTLLEEVEEDIYNQRLNEAYEKLEAYMNDDSRRYVNDDKIEFHVFTNDFEELLFKKYAKTEKEVRMIPFKVPVYMLYYYYAYLLVEFNRLDEAEQYLKEALEYNPVSLQVLFELIDLYKKQKDWDNMNKYIELAFKYAYTPDAMARIYQDLGYYYVELEQYEVAATLYIYSLKFEPSEMAYAELEYIKNLGQPIEITMNEARKTIEDNNIQTVANPFIVKEYRDSGDRYAEVEDLENALQMYLGAYILDDSMENQLRYKMAEAAVNGDKQVNITF